MKACGKGLISHEYQLEATFTYSCMMRGLRYNAYKCIAGSGPNSAVLHYNTNTRKIEPGELVLLDAGAEHQFYASDITRTFPISGKFSQTQRTIYTIVLSAQKNAIAAARPGIDFNDIIKIATTTLLEGLLEVCVKEALKCVSQVC
jgi:Xaa-Pro aminopeptidase